jgi:hypothetical protein
MMNVDDILEKLGCDGSSKHNSAKQWNVDFSLLEGNAKDDFSSAFNHYRKANDKRRTADEWDYSEILQYFLNAVVKHPFPCNCDWQVAHCCQKLYKRKNLYMESQEPDKFCDRILKLNGYLEYLPVRYDECAPPKALTEHGFLCAIPCI